MPSKPLLPLFTDAIEHKKSFAGFRNCSVVYAVTSAVRFSAFCAKKEDRKGYQSHPRAPIRSGRISRFRLRRLMEFAIACKPMPPGCRERSPSGRRTCQASRPPGKSRRAGIEGRYRSKRTLQSADNVHLPRRSVFPPAG